RHQLVEAWLTAFLPNAGDGVSAYDLPEAVAIELCGTGLPRYDSSAQLSIEVTGLLGSHPRIVDHRLNLRLDELLARTRRFRAERVPAYRAYQRARNDLLVAE